LPDWLPRLIAKRAQALIAEAENSSHVEDLALIRRLTTDPRMKSVWKYLQRKKRNHHKWTGDYENPVFDPIPNAPFPAPFPSRSVWMQHLAMEKFYCDLICMMTWGRFGRFGAPHPATEDLAKWRTPYLERAAELRAEAKLVSEINRSVENCPRELDKVAHRLTQAAVAYEELAHASHADSERRVPAVVTAQIAKDLKVLFGRKMYGQAATVASVILEREVTAAETREWCRSAGWVKVQRKPSKISRL
jgi:hypothetical protein